MFKFWRWLPAKVAHCLAPTGLSIYSSFFQDEPLIWNPLHWRGLVFPNRLGVAGGVDKNARQILDWQRAGAGFVEVGTVTPLPQDPNPGKILDRDWDRKILWNKMGFPNDGSAEIFYNLRSAESELKIPVFVNIGKNRQTDNSNAFRDYQYLAEKFSTHCSALVVNVSSPNTTGLRDLQSSDELRKLIETVVQTAGRTPVLVKLSPDLTEENLSLSLEAALSAGASGFVLTNTTVSRQKDSLFPTEGGVSGTAVAELSKKQLVSTIKLLGSQRQGLLIVSVGGILTPMEVKERMHIGADLVQVYSALVFEGPSFFRKTVQEMGR